MQKVWYRENRIPCGHYMDVQIFPVFPVASRRGKKKKPTSAIQERLNEENALKELVRIIQLNFTNKDYAIHLTYDNDALPESEEEAKRDVQNFMRRLKRHYIKTGAAQKASDLKYIWVTEKGEKSARLHHHLITSGGGDRNEIERIWKKGYCQTKLLRFTKNGLAGLAHYIIKQPLYFRRWNSSKNLLRPETYSRDNFYKRRELAEICEKKNTAEEFEKKYPGWGVIEEPVKMHNKVNGGYYVSLRLYRYVIWPKDSNPPRRVAVAADERYEKIWEKQWRCQNEQVSHHRKN